MGYFAGDWEYSSYRKAIDKAVAKGNKTITLDTEHCSYLSDESIKRWAEKDGYQIRIAGDSLTVVLKQDKSISDKQLQDVCKIKQEGACRYITCGANGFECEKHGSLAKEIDSRVALGLFNAIGDNCEGLQ